MNRFKSFIGATVATLYFIYAMSIAILLLIFMPMGFLFDVNTIRTSGFATSNTSIMFISITGLIIGLSMIVPVFRRIYKFFPWMHAFIKVFFINLVILCIALYILNKGYEVVNSTRHTVAFILMIIQIIICRLTMCLYFKKNPIKSIK